MTQQQKQKRERPPRIGDLIGKRVRVTYYRRDVTNLSENRGSGDVDEVIEGTLKTFTHRSEDKFCFNGSVSVCGRIITDEGSTRLSFLPLDGPYSYSGYMGHLSSKFDGKRSGSYNVELLGEEEDAKS